MREKISDYEESLWREDVILGGGRNLRALRGMRMKRKRQAGNKRRTLGVCRFIIRCASTCKRVNADEQTIHARLLASNDYLFAFNKPLTCFHQVAKIKAALQMTGRD